MKFIIVSLLAFLAFTNFGCATNPPQQVKELRAFYTEAQIQSNNWIGDKNYDQKKVQEVRATLDTFAPIMDQLEVLAADPTKALDFQTLWIQYRPKIELAVFNIIAKKYLGV